MSAAADPLRRIEDLLTRRGVARKLAFALAALAVAAGIATYWALEDRFGGAIDARGVLLLLYVDLAIVLLLAAVIGWRIVRLALERRDGAAGSRLTLRLVAMFSAVAVAPTILLAMFSALFLNIGLESWFSDRVRAAVGGAQEVATFYLDEHRRNVRADALSMAVSISRDGRLIDDHPRLLRQMVSQLAQERRFSEAMVFRGDGQPLARAGFDFSLNLAASVPENALIRARLGEIPFLDDNDETHIRALIKLQRFVDTYLLVTRLVDPRVLGAIDRTAGAVDRFEAMEGRRSQLQLTFGLVFGLVALLLLLAAVWTGLTLATSISRPITALIGAAQRVGGGDLSARVAIDENDRGDEVAALSRGFNAMTEKLEAQQSELVDAYKQIDSRRAFSEAVLAGVAAGVVSLDGDGRIGVANRFALERLGRVEAEVRDRPLSAITPAFEAVIDAAQRSLDGAAEAEVRLIRPDGAAEILIARVAAESRGGGGYVLTFSDLSDLVDAQRKAAWADVARRIAHEIKNPLTPIQLSAERLKRKYLNEIQTDPHVFETCVDTIVRQVGDIGRMVGEFSAFARMPQPRMEAADIAALARGAATLQRAGHRDIKFEVEVENEPVLATCDPRLIEQALSNLVLNSAQAIHARWAAGEPGGGLVRVVVRRDGAWATAAVEDDGCGLPEGAARRTLTEPYVTTKKKGTGLGLAIVAKVLADHGGDLHLGDRPGGGAVAWIKLPAAEPAEAAA